MSSVRGERVKLGQADGSEIELVVTGNEDYAHYETLAGYSVIYGATGQFEYARVVDGRFVSTGIPADRSPPADLVPHAIESPEVRSAKGAARRSARERP